MAAEERTFRDEHRERIDSDRALDAHEATVARSQVPNETRDNGAVAPEPYRRAQRDVRLDFFRGLALLFIFIDHTSSNVIADFTLQAFAFCDAGEVFFFISGFAASLAYGGILARRGALPATARIYGRIWQLYVAHVFVFVAYMALVSFLLKPASDPALAQHLGESEFLSRPGVALMKFLLLGFQPTVFFILPLYMLLLALFPVVLMLIRRSPLLVLGLSIALYLAAHRFDWTFHSYPDHEPWSFNPLAYQLLFVGGAVCGYLTSSGKRILPDRKWIYGIAAVILVACAAICFSHSLNAVFTSFPILLPDVPWQIPEDKRDISLLRLINFLALAVVATRLIRRDATFLRGALARPIVLCGQNSLPVFCQGILLSTLGSYILDEVTDRLRIQLLVIAVGVALTLGLVYLITWYKRVSRPAASAPMASPPAMAVAE